MMYNRFTYLFNIFQSEKLIKIAKIIFSQFLLFILVYVESYTQTTWTATISGGSGVGVTVLTTYYLQRKDGSEWINVDSATVTGNNAFAARDFGAFIVSGNSFRIRVTNNWNSSTFYNFSAAPAYSAEFTTGARTQAFTRTDIPANSRFVEGFVKKNGYGVSGVTMIFMIPYIANSDTRTTEDDGFYRMLHNNNPAGWDTYGLAFLPTGITDIASPSSRTRANNQDGAGQDFELISPVDIAVLSGRIVGGFRAPANLSNFQITISGGGQTYLTTTDASGNYSYNVLKTFDYTVTASKDGYSITYANPQTLLTVAGDASFGDITATPVDITISGALTTIFPNPGVTLSLSGTYAHGGAVILVDSATTTSNIINGSYSFTIPKGALGTWTVTPKSTTGGGRGYSFNPTYRSITTPTTTPITGQDFDVSKKIVKISGTVKDYYPNPDLELQGIAVQLWDDSPTRVLVQQSYTDASGVYEIWANARTAYRIKPLNTNTGYLFVDTTSLIDAGNYNTVADYIDYTAATLYGDTPDQNFSGRLQHYDIVGKVVDASNIGLSGYVVNLWGVNPYGPPNDSVHISSDPSLGTGEYSILSIPARGNYKVAATGAPAGGLFVPGEREYMDLRQSYTPILTPALPQDFKLYGSDAVIVNGKVVLAGTAVGLSNVLITIKESGVTWNTTFTDGSGNYSFPGKSGSNYTVLAEKDGYSITSSGGNPQTTGVLTVPKTLVDFEATFVLAVPKPSSPLNNAIVSLRPMLLWNLSIGAQSYDVEVYEGSFAGTKIILSGSTDIPYTQNFYNIPTGALASGIKYVWRVRAKTASGNSAWSNTAYVIDASFTTSPDIPTLKNPINAAQGQPSNVTFEWYPVAGASMYTLQYSKDPNFMTKTEKTNISSTTQFEIGLEMNAIYFWRVKVSAPIESGWSESWYFDVGGSFSWDPSSIDFENVLISKTKYRNITFFNNAGSPVGIPAIEFTNSNFGNILSAQMPIIIPAYSSRIITVNFSPTSVGVKTGRLKVYHNVSTQLENPIEIPLTGNCVAAISNIEYTPEIDFGTVALFSGVREKSVTIKNLSTEPDEVVVLNSSYFDSLGSVFSIKGGFPVYIFPGTSAEVIVQFDPKKLGSHLNYLHILNNSVNAPNATIRIKGRVIDGNLVVIPTSIDYGKTSIETPWKIDTVYLINYSVLPITVFSKIITQDTESFHIVRSSGRITLNTYEVDTVLIKFEPHDAEGRKFGVLDVTCNDPVSAKRYVSLTGIAGDRAVIAISPAEIDFGNMIVGNYKDTLVTIKNEGSIYLLLKSMEISGIDQSMFTLIEKVENKTLIPRDTVIIKLRAIAKMIGQKRAILNFYSNDKTNPVFPITLKANVQSPVFWKEVDKIVWDTVASFNCVDTVFKIGNIGNSTLHISKFYMDGPNANDFKVLGQLYPFVLQPGEIKEMRVSYCPKDAGIKYARLVFQCDDPVNPEPYIVFRSNTMKIYSELISDTLIDFGKVTVNEASNREFEMQNNSKYSDLIIDSIKISFVQYHPFSYDVEEFPVKINRGGTYNLPLKFQPFTEVIKKYNAYLYIYYSNPSKSPARIRMVGEVIRPKANVSLQSVLKFGKVQLDSIKSQTFLINNSGDGDLIVSNILRIGPDSLEFSLNERYPLIITPDTSQIVTVKFNPKKIGSKDAQLKIIWNDPTNEGIIDIWAEGIPKGAGVLFVNNGEIPKKYNLAQNYPNPFNPGTNIKFTLMKSGVTTLKVYNILGKEVCTLINGFLDFGEYNISFDASRYPSGIYYYRLQSDQYKEMKKMIFLK